MNLLLIDENIPGLNIFTESINENSKYIIYRYSDTFDELEKKIYDFGLEVFENLSIVFVDDHRPTKLFVSFNSFISFSNNTIQSNLTTDFFKKIINKYQIKNLDFLACNLLSYPLWKKYFDFIMNENAGLIIRASNDRTGNLNSGGDWILETTNEDIKKLYFNENINNWNYLLDLGYNVIGITSDVSNNLLTAGDNFNGNAGNNQKLNFFIADVGTSGKNIISISCGFQFTVILTDELSNNVYAVGRNTFGQLGIGNTTNQNQFIRANTGIEGKKVNKIIVSKGIQYPKTFVLTDENTNNLYGCGQIEFNGTSLSSNFVNLTQGISGKKIIELDCYEGNTIVLSDEGTNNLYGYGINSQGSLGLGNNISYNTFQNITTNISGKKIINCSLGENFSFIILDDSTNNLYSCGINSFGQLGLGNNSTYYTFQNVTTNISGKKVIKVSTNSYSSYILIDETSNNLYSCGINNLGQLGLGNNTNYSTFQNVTLNINSKKIIDIASNTSHVLILTDDSSNNLFGCFSNNQGQIGLGIPQGFNVFTNVQNNLINKKITKINCGYGHSGILTDALQNNFFTAGTGDFGELANKTYYYYSPVFGLDGKTFESASTSKYSISVITNESSNNLYTSGGNRYGVLGNGTMDNKYFLTLANSGIENKKVIMSSLGEYHHGIITDESMNNLYVCGRNSYGQLLQGTSDSDPHPSFLQVNLNNKKAIYVYCNWDGIFILTNEPSNNLYGGGGNYFGHLGIGTSDYDPHPNLINITLGIEGKKIMKVISVSNTSIITSETSNNYYSVGDNTSGQFGNGTYDSSYIFQKITKNIFNKKVSNIACGEYHNIIITNDSSNNLFTSGYNSWGQLGLDSVEITINELSNVSINISNKKIYSSKCSADTTQIYTIDPSKNLYAAGYDYGQIALGYNSINSKNKVFLNPAAYDFTQFLNNASKSNSNPFFNLGANNTIYYLREYDKYIGLNESVMTEQEILDDFGNVIIDLQSYDGLNLSPEDTTFDNYISFTINITDTTNLLVYFKSSSDVDPVLLKIYDDGYGAYYEVIDTTHFKVYTKHFSKILYGKKSIPCLTEDTLISTPFGYKNIKDLDEGDLILTENDRIVPIKRILVSNVKGNKITYPFVIPKNSIGKNYPPVEFKISGEHLIKYKNTWIHPRRSKMFKQDSKVSSIKYYHIELPNYETDNLIINGGVIVESFAGEKNRKTYVQRSLSNKLKFYKY